MTSPAKGASQHRGTNEAAVRALKNGRTGFRTWDALGRKTAANQIGTLSRWNKGEQTP
jgi:hypothetical protein